jgi:outer membrane protein OmpU
MRIFASTLSGALFVAGAASAQGISLFGDARLGLGYNIDNDGGVLVDEDGDAPDDLRAVSRVRFGVNTTGENDSGITFGATIRADNAIGGEGGSGDESGQTEGEVFVSGSWGSLTFGDTNGADEQWVGDVPGNFSLTGLGDNNETLFVSNGGSFGEDNGTTFAENPEARPTVRYDFDFQNFGVSLSSNRDLTDITVGAGYAADFGGGSWSVGAGYNSFSGFTAIGEPEFEIAPDGTVTEVIPEVQVPDGEQWSVGLHAEYSSFELGVTYMKLTSDTTADGKGEADSLLVGGAYTFDAVSVGAFWGQVLSASGPEELSNLDGDDTYGLTAQYDLGGGASVNGGIAKSYSISPTEDESATVADFGISMEF